MIWLTVGTGAFGFLVLFEIHKCASARKKQESGNPWFLVGTVLLVLTFIGMGITASAAEGVRVPAGIMLLMLGIVSYGAALTAGLRKKIYLQDDADAAVSRDGLYGRMRHPGVWSFLLCSLGFGAVFPGRMGEALWFALLNLIYTWLQDRYFFPVYLQDYEEYKKEVPYLIPKRRQPRD